MKQRTGEQQDRQAALQETLNSSTRSDKDLASLARHALSHLEAYLNILYQRGWESSLHRTPHGEKDPSTWRTEVDLEIRQRRDLVEHL